MPGLSDALRAAAEQNDERDKRLWALAEKWRRKADAVTAWARAYGRPRPWEADVLHEHADELDAAIPGRQP